MIEVLDGTNQCDKCAHKDVCRFKKEFVNATEQLMRTTISTGENNMIRLCDIPYIRPVKLICKYCLILPENTLMRKTD